MTGRRFAYLGVSVGLVVSVAANVAHAAGQPGGASVWALGMAGFWPVALFLALEVLTRNQWAGGRGLVVARSGVGVVAVVAACLSYLHLRALLVSFGESVFSATIGPLGVDGLMAVSAAALLIGHGTELEPVAAQATEPVSEPVAVPVAESTPEVVEAPMPAPDAPAVPVRTPRAAPKRKSAPAASVTSDADLLAQVDAAVAAGELEAATVTLTRLRSLLGVGATRADRLAKAWHEAHRLTAVRSLPTASAGN